MITQNLFNKKPKTFMDYEPGKVPNKNEWNKQTTTKTKTYEPFASNVKLVGDDMTEKDYDTFFEGFNSVNIIPSQKKTRSVQNSPIQDMLYRPFVDGKSTIQKFSYSPSKNGGTETSLFSELPSTYSQVKKAPKTLLEKAWYEIK